MLRLTWNLFFVYNIMYQDLKHNGKLQWNQRKINITTDYRYSLDLRSWIYFNKYHYWEGKDKTTKTKIPWHSQNYLSLLGTTSPNSVSLILVKNDSFFSYPRAYFKFCVWRSNFESLNYPRFRIQWCGWKQSALLFNIVSSKG